MVTFFGDVGPLWSGEGVLSLSDPLLHAGGDGGSPRAVEWRKPTEPGGGVGGGEREMRLGRCYRNVEPRLFFHAEIKMRSCASSTRPQSTCTGILSQVVVFIIEWNVCHAWATRH